MKNCLLLLLVLGTGWFLLSLVACQHSPILPDGGNPPNPQDTTITNPGDTTTTGTPCDPDVVYFQTEVLPLLVSSCAKSGCHDPATAKDGVVLNSYNSVMSTADVDPFDPEGSDLYEVLVEDDPDKKMPPPPASVDPDFINLIYEWIDQGAENLECDPNAGGCDTDNVTYSADVLPILELNCLGCHSGASPQGNIDLSTYNNVKTMVDNGRLLGSIKHEAGFVAMPFGGSQLSACSIDQIEAWINDGALNN